MVDQSNIGQLIKYWSNGTGAGQHCGTLLRIEKTTAVIKHPTKKKEQKAPVADCEPYGEKLMNTIYEQLFRAAQTMGFTKQPKNQSDTEHIIELVKIINSVPAPVWDAIPIPAQEWFNNAVVVINQMKVPPQCPGFIGRDEVANAIEMEVPPAGRTAKEVFANPPTIVEKAKAFQKSEPKKKRTVSGIMDALRRIVILHPEWTSRQVYDYLKLNGFPDAKLDTISVDGGNIRRVIEIAKELGLWNDKSKIQEAAKESQSTDTIKPTIVTDEARSA